MWSIGLWLAVYGTQVDAWVEGVDTLIRKMQIRTAFFFLAQLDVSDGATNGPGYRWLQQLSIQSGE